MRAFNDGLALAPEATRHLLELTPGGYVGVAESLAKDIPVQSCTARHDAAAPRGRSRGFRKATTSGQCGRRSTSPGLRRRELLRMSGLTDTPINLQWQPAKSDPFRPVVSVRFGVSFPRGWPAPRLCECIRSLKRRSRDNCRAHLARELLCGSPSSASTSSSSDNALISCRIQEAPEPHGKLNNPCISSNQGITEALAVIPNVQGRQRRASPIACLTRRDASP